MKIPWRYPLLNSQSPYTSSTSVFRFCLKNTTSSPHHYPLVQVAFILHLDDCHSCLTDFPSLQSVFQTARVINLRMNLSMVSFLQTSMVQPTGYKWKPGQVFKVNHNLAPKSLCSVSPSATLLRTGWGTYPLRVLPPDTLSSVLQSPGGTQSNA